MAYTLLSNCPVCSHSLNVTRLECSHCDTKIENTFELSKLSILTAEQLNFVEVFLISRGNIKEVEKELGISYPTVRSKLNEVIHLLKGEEPDKKSGQTKLSTSDIITMLENGELSTEEAVELLKK